MINRLVVRVFTALVAIFIVAVSGCAYGPQLRTDVLPVVFMHDEGDSANYWQDVVWRFESNGWPRDRLFALQQPYDQAVEEGGTSLAGRSTEAASFEFLKSEVDRVLAQTGAKRVVLVGNGRAGVTIRNYILSGGGDQTTERIVLAQPLGPWLGVPKQLSAADYDAEALKGVKSLVINHVDLPAGVFTPQAFGQSYQFISGQAPASVAIWPQVELVLDGMVTGMGLPTGERASAANRFFNNRPAAKAWVEVFVVQPGTGLRMGAPVYQKAVDAQGHWGPFRAQQGSYYEFVVHAPGYAVTHIYRSPFPRGSRMLHLRADRIAMSELPAYAIIHLDRARGHFDPTVNHTIFDGQSPPPGIAVSAGVPVATSKITLDKLQNRAIAAEIHTDMVERIVGRTWPAKESNVVRLEFSQ